MLKAVQSSGAIGSALTCSLFVEQSLFFSTANFTPPVRKTDGIFVLDDEVQRRNAVLVVTILIKTLAVQSISMTSDRSHSRLQDVLLLIDKYTHRITSRLINIFC